MTATIRAHNEGAAAVWGSSGSAYDKVSETIADVLDRVVARVALSSPTTRNLGTIWVWPCGASIS